MSKENEMRFLKLFIYSMGVVMMLGVMIITYTIYKRNIVLDKEYMAANQETKCSFDTIKIPNVAKSASLNHDKLTILTEGQQVLIYDACTGKLLNKIKLTIE
jgi:hypothetical protein